MIAATWVSDSLSALRIIAWPLTILALVLLFRKQLSERVGSIRKAQLPGGISFELGTLEKEVISTPEIEAENRLRISGRAATEPLTGDRAYTVANVRVDLDQALRRLAFAVNRDPEFATRNIEDLLLDLQSSGEISTTVGRQTLEFMRLSAASYSVSDLSDDDVVAFHTVGSLLASHVRYLRRIASLATGVVGHELWHWLDDRAGPVNRGGRQTWAAIATILPEVAYDYEVFRAAIHRMMETRDGRNWPPDVAPKFGQLLVSSDEFLEIVVFRRDELRRILRLYDRRSWYPSDDDKDDLYYNWPADWGEIRANMPVSRGNLQDVADDLLEAEEAVRRMRLTAAERRGSKAPARR